MIRHCAWCGLLLGQVAPFDNPDATHGICTACQQLLQEDMREFQQTCANTSANDDDEVGRR
jgi:hypothetical protein